MFLVLPHDGPGEQLMVDSILQLRHLKPQSQCIFSDGVGASICPTGR